MSHLIGNRHESANAQGPRNELSASHQLVGEIFRRSSYAAAAISIALTEFPGPDAFFGQGQQGFVYLRQRFVRRCQWRARIHGAEGTAIRRMNEPVTLCSGGGHAVVAWVLFVYRRYRKI